MTTPTASLTALPQPVADATATGRSSQPRAAGTDSPFQSALAAAGRTRQTQQAQQTDTANATNATTDTAAASASQAATDDKADREKKDDAKDATLAGLLALAAQLLAPPANTAAAQVTEQTAAASGTSTDLTAAVTANPAATRTRADQLRLDRAGGLLSTPAGAPATQAANAAQTAAEATLATANSARTSTPATPAVPTPTPNETTARAATATALRGGTSSIPAQPQIVANAIPIPPVPADPSVTAPPVSEPTAALPATAVPSAQLGDRPTTTGERFAALASAGAQLAASGPPASVAFANTLAQVAAAPALAGAAPSGTVLPLTNIDGALAPPPLQATDSRPSDDAAGVAPTGTAPLPPLPALDRGAPAAPAAVPATPAAQVAEAVVVHSHVLERDGVVEFRMRLDPPDLGRVQIRLITRGDEVYGQVLVADDAVRRLIESQLPELRQRLEAAGVNIQRFDVATDSGTGGSQSAYREFTGAALAPRVPTGVPAPAPQARIGRFEAGSLDVTV